jgi:glycosyltransferase involved in cell wall biosynthesis
MMGKKYTPDEKVLFSVIITCYNLEKYIARAINSCLNQTLSDSLYEIIVVDDCSTDSSWNTISSFGSMIKAVRHETNLGVACASNTGIKIAKGKYIARVDGDDFINKNFMYTMSQFLEWNDDIGFAYCDHIVVNENLERKQSMNTLEKILDHGAGIVFRKKYLEAIGLYDENLRNREDYDLILRYIKNFNGHHVRLPYYRYFKRSGSLSTDLQMREDLKKQINERQNVSS